MWPTRPQFWLGPKPETRDEDAPAGDTEDANDADEDFADGMTENNEDALEKAKEHQSNGIHPGLLLISKSIVTKHPKRIKALKAHKKNMNIVKK